VLKVKSAVVDRIAEQIRSTKVNLADETPWVNLAKNATSKSVGQTTQDPMVEH